MNEWLRILLFGILIVLLQGFLFSHISWVGVGPPFVFLLFLMLLPTSLSTATLMIIAFFTGLGVDLLADSYATGLHAAACVPMITLRNRFLEIAAGSNVRSGAEIDLFSLRTSEFISMAFPLILVHHLVYYILEALTFRHLFITFLELITGGTLTFLVCLTGYLIFFKRK